MRRGRIKVDTKNNLFQPENRPRACVIIRYLKHCYALQLVFYDIRRETIMPVSKYTIITVYRANSPIKSKSNGCICTVTRCFAAILIQLKAKLTRVQIITSS
ncbi:eukaryotic translation initiation factor 6 [Trichinella spiralis]|uniref:eukaryotic translation initiation factor 6 n=1 Tax=Trichinella spiralis TaxID=6334 RepID=UPI0001EFCE1B|nr:eukaryotic translation initiation factor 6 [Trichinella spiralis]